MNIRIGLSECNDAFEVCCEDREIIKNPPQPPVNLMIDNSECGLRNAKGIEIKLAGNVNGEAEYG